MNDRDTVTPAAAQAFRPLLRVAQSLAGASIMCHSMGNYLLRLAAAAPPHQQRSTRSFEQVFMVAADVHRDIFNSIHNKSSTQQQHGKNIAALARRRVHVMHSSKDLALSVGRRLKLKLQPALGSSPYGVHPQKIHKDLRNKVVNKNCNKLNKWSWDNKLWHSYPFKKGAIEYYEAEQQKSSN